MRVIIYVLCFVLIRDTMTPLRFWSFGTEGFFWIRFADNYLVLVFFGISSATLAVFLFFIDKDNKNIIKWIKEKIHLSIISGFIGLIVTVLPLLIYYMWIPMSQRGGAVNISLIVPLFVVTMGGNLLEEFLFRGYFQGKLLSEGVSNMKAIILSGLFFGAGHVFLATTVTAIGIPLLIFALWEGTICAYVYSRGGVVASTITHGGAIFILASGLV